jgi:hypothetical protein
MTTSHGFIMYFISFFHNITNKSQFDHVDI